MTNELIHVTDNQEKGRQLFAYLVDQTIFNLAKSGNFEFINTVSKILPTPKVLLRGGQNAINYCRENLKLCREFFLLEIQDRLAATFAELDNPDNVYFEMHADQQKPFQIEARKVLSSYQDGIIPAPDPRDPEINYLEIMFPECYRKGVIIPEIYQKNP
jgi:hypothetical protein